MADFGYKVEGATKHTLYNNVIYGCQYTGAAGIGISITWNLCQYGAYTPTIKFGLYDTNGDFVENSETEEWVLTEGWDGEKTLNFNVAPSLTAQNYHIAIWFDSVYLYSYYDAGDPDQTETESRAYNSFPAHIGWLGSSWARKETAYCTYTPAGEPPAYYHGLKVQGEGELALCDVGSHPLRIRKGGTTYGIELVDTTDPNASTIRIKTSAGIKALRKFT